MSLLILGLSHKTASVDIREKLAFPEKIQPDALKTLCEVDGVNEAVILSTCNRTEIYVDVIEPIKGVKTITDFMTSYHDFSIDEAAELKKHLYSLQDVAMVQHLFEVVSSLDSLVLGEAQILAQIRSSYYTALDAGACGDIFKHLFRQALEVGKRVRTETSIGANSVSVSTTAVHLAERVFEDLEKRHVLVVGAGEMGELTVNYLIERGVKQVTVTNRTLGAAQDLAGRIGGTAAPFDDLVACMRQADIVISSTAAPGYVITKEQVVAARKKKSGHSFLLIDIALPRDIDPACGDIDDVYVYDLDAFMSIIDSNIAQREIESENARTMIAEEVELFLTWMQERKVVPTIAHMYAKMDRLCNHEVEHAAKQLATAKGAPITEEEFEVLKALAQGVGKKILHGPTVRLRKQAANPDAYLYTESARFLFGLDTNPEGKTCRSCTLSSRCRKQDVGGTCLIAEQAGFSHSN